MIKQAWFECGLLHNYSIQQYVQVLSNFNFDSVLIDPLKLDAYGVQRDICDGAYELCDAVDLYAEEHSNFTKFLIVGGGSTYLNYTLVEHFKDSGYVMVMDDSGENLTSAREIFQYLKSLGVETGLVHPYWDGAKQLINEDLIDYSMPCFYPFFINVNNFSKLVGEFNVMRIWCNGKCKFLPAIQVFAGGDPVRRVLWRFPSSAEVQTILNYLIDLNPHGIMWFLPHSGVSERGETFEGFLDHAEVWDIIKNPMKRDIGFAIPYEVVVIAIPIGLYGLKKFIEWLRNRESD